MDCRVEIFSRHIARNGWEDDRCTIQQDTPDELRVGFCDAAKPGSHPGDVLLSLAIGAPRRPSKSEAEDDGQGSEAIRSRGAQSEAGYGQAGADTFVPGHAGGESIGSFADP